MEHVFSSLLIITLIVAITRLKLVRTGDRDQKTGKFVGVEREEKEIVRKSVTWITDRGLKVEYI